MERAGHRPTVWSMLISRKPHCRRCGHLAPCPVAVEGGRSGVDDLEAGERAAAVRRLVQFTGYESRANGIGHR